MARRVEADTSADPLSVKLARHKPAEAVDACFRAGGVVQDVMCTDPATGVPGWQYYGNPRLVAGWPFTLDHFKCQLKPLDRADYIPIAFTDAQWAQLDQAFPTGVCDYSKPPVGQQPSIPWLTFADGPGRTAARRPAHVNGAGAGLVGSRSTTPHARCSLAVPRMRSMPGKGGH